MWCGAESTGGTATDEKWESAVDAGSGEGREVGVGAVGAEGAEETSRGPGAGFSMDGDGMEEALEGMIDEGGG